MAPSNNLRLVNRKVEMLDVPVVAVMQGCTKILQFLFQDLTLLSERLKKVLQGPAGKNKRNAGLKPFKDLRLEELRDECRARELENKGQKKELQEILKEEIGGIQRVPAIMFFDQEKKLADLALGKHCILSNTNVVNINK